MANYLGLMAKDYEAFFIYRDKENHSGNWYALEVCIERGLLLGHEFGVGKYGDRLDGHVKLCPTMLCLWSHA